MTRCRRWRVSNCTTSHRAGHDLKCHSIMFCSQCLVHLGSSILSRPQSKAKASSLRFYQGWLALGKKWMRPALYLASISFYNWFPSFTSLSSQYSRAPLHKPLALSLQAYVDLACCQSDQGRASAMQLSYRWAFVFNWLWGKTQTKMCGPRR